MERISQILFDLMVGTATTFHYRGARRIRRDTTGEIPRERYRKTPHREDPHDEPRSGKRRADASCRGERDPGGRRDHPHVDKTIRHARDPVDRAKPAHLPGNALYLPWRRRV